VDEQEKTGEMRTVSEENKKIIIGSDHAAFPLKEAVKGYLEKMGYEITDVGTHSTESASYVDFGKQVSESISTNAFERGILLCGTGLGMSMVANRYPHVRAALCSDVFSVRMSREHNDSNILVLGGRLIGDILAFELVKTWLETKFEGGRHLTRLEGFDSLA